MEPAAGLARVDDRNPALSSDLGPVCVPEDQDVVQWIGASPGLPSFFEVPLNRDTEVGNQEPQTVMLENKRRLDDLSQLLEDFHKAPLLSIAIPENAFDWASQIPELPCCERSNKVAGMDDQAAFLVVEEPDRPPQGDKVVMGVRQDADHASIV